MLGRDGVGWGGCMFGVSSWWEQNVSGAPQISGSRCRLEGHEVVAFRLTLLSGFAQREHSRTPSDSPAERRWMFVACQLVDLHSHTFFFISSSQVLALSQKHFGFFVCFF